jgi:exoribonuclease R
MGKGKKGGKRMNKAQLTEILQQFFAERPGETLSFKEIFRSLHLTTHPLKMLAIDIMEEMAWDDYLAKVSDNSYRLNQSVQVMEGKFVRKANGKNSVIPDGEENPIFVSERNSMGALNGDRVEFTFLARRKNHIKEAQVNKILERAKDTFVGRLKVDKDLAYLVTPSDVFAHNIIIPRRKVKGGKTDDKAVVRIIEWPDGENKSPIGEVVDILGQKGDNDVEMNSILAQYGLPYKYPKNVEDAANKISGEITEQDYKEREDFRKVFTCTIDPKDAKDFGLAFEYYTHFTSPIRRYPDTMVHRLLTKYAQGGRSANEKHYEELCEHCSDMEQIAQNAERDSIKYKMVEFMGDKLGEEFDAHISGITSYGIYATIDENHCEGMIPMRDIADDYYDFDEKNFCLIGRRHHNKYQLGDAIRIKVAQANLEKKQLASFPFSPFRYFQPPYGWLGA